MNVLVTGSGGFVGSALCSYLRKNTPWEIYSITHSGEAGRIVDITDSTAIDELGKTLPQIGCVIHTAAISKPGDCRKKPTICRDVNVHATAKLARTFTDATFVLFSTYAVYNTPAGNASEDAPVEATNEYIRSKLDAEAMVRKYCQDKIILRPSVIYGPGDERHPNYFTSLIKTLDSGRVMRSPTDQFFNPVHVDVLCEVVRFAIERDAIGTYNVGSNEAVSKYDFNKSIMKLYGYDKSLLVGYTGMDPDGVDRPKNATIDSSRIQKDTNYTIPPFGDMIKMLKTS